MMAAALLGIFGTMIGSFLNVVIFRVPAGRSIVAPPSACPTCGSRIRGYDNVPVLSWLMLRGRCRVCRTGISARYPTVELGTGLFFAAVTIWFLNVHPLAAEPTGAVGGILRLIALLYLAAISVTLSLIDLDTHRLPNVIVLPGYVVGAVLLGAAALLAGEAATLVTAGIGMAAMFGVYLLMAFVYPNGMGLGDVKLAGVLGLYLGSFGWEPLVVGAFAAFVLGGLFALVLVALRRVSRTGGIPFGPWMLAGAWLGIFAGVPIAHAYLRLFGL